MSFIILFTNYKSLPLLYSSCLYVYYLIWMLYFFFNYFTLLLCFFVVNCLMVNCVSFFGKFYIQCWQAHLWILRNTILCSIISVWWLKKDGNFHIYIFNKMHIITKFGSTYFDECWKQSWQEFSMWFSHPCSYLSGYKVYNNVMNRKWYCSGRDMFSWQWILT